MVRLSLAALVLLLGCSSKKSPPDPGKPVAELLQAHSAKELLAAGIVTPIAVGDIPKALLEGPICSPQSRAEFRPDGTWGESEVDAAGKVVRTMDGTWVAEAACYRMTLGPQKLGCLNEGNDVFRDKAGKVYIAMPQKIWTPCP